MKYEKSVLPNGIRVVTVPIPALESVTINILVNVGSRHEKDTLSGISHFLEHIIMDGGKAFPSANNLWEAVDTIGGSMNASTSKTVTDYYVKLHVDHKELGFQMLSDILTNTRFAPKDIKKERTVILDEIAMGNDNPKRVMWKAYDRLIYNGDALSREVIGTKEIVSNMKKSDLQSYKERHYVAENIVIACAGGVTHKQIMDLSKKYFSSIKSKPESKNVLKDTSITPHKTRLSVINKDIEQTSFAIGFPSISLEDERRFAGSILDTVLGGGVSSRLYSLIREKHALAYSVGTDISSYHGTGDFSAYAGTDPKNAIKALKLILNEFEKMKSPKTAKLTKKEFNKAISFTKGHVALAMESSSWLATRVGVQELVRERIETPEEYFKQLEKTTPNEVIAFANQIFDFDKMVLSVIGPHKDDSEFAILLK